MSSRVLIVGAGVTGLSAALTAAEHAEVLLFDSTGRVGGVIRSERAGAFLVEAGPDTLLGRKGAAAELCERLGLGDRIVDLSARYMSPSIVRRGQLVPLPAGLAMLAPTRLLPLLRSPLLSPAGRLRMAAERFVPARRSMTDESLSSFVRRRYGREAVDVLAQPFVAALFLGDAERLSATLTVPYLVTAEREHGSIARGLAAWKREDAAAARPELFSLSGGLQTLVDAAAARLPAGTLRRGVAVKSLVRDDSTGGFRATTSDGATWLADAAILACPAHAAAGIVEDLDPTLARELASLDYASCATVSLAYRRDAIDRPPAGFGFFVPRAEPLPFVACNVVSNKFPERAPRNCVFLRAFVGGAGGAELLEADDEVLADTVHAGLARLFGLHHRPVFMRVCRYSRAMPQPEVGEADRRERLDARLSAHPGLFVAGGGRGAIGLPDSIASGLLAGSSALGHAREASSSEGTAGEGPGDR